jgi:tryptophan 2,3-dioxygenase
MSKAGLPAGVKNVYPRYRPANGSEEPMVAMKESVSFQEVCVLLGLSWKALQTTLSEFDGVIGPEPAGIQSRHLSMRAFDRLRKIIDMQRAGIAPDAIGREMAAIARVEGAVDIPARPETAMATTASEICAATAIERLAPTAGQTGEAGGPPVVAGVVSARASDTERLAIRLDELARQIVRLEEALLTEKHRSVAAVARLQQELQQLRYEAVTGVSRRERRRRRGFWSDLWDF